MFIRKFASIFDRMLVPFVFLAAWLLRKIRLIKLHRLPRCRNLLMNLGVYPVLDHYYEPQFNFNSPRIDFSEERNLPGLDLNVAGQLSMLKKLRFGSELADIFENNGNQLDYRENDFFGAGDADYWYQIIRTVKPRRIFEIGSGHSTLLAIKALQRNRYEDPSYACQHVCIEPFEKPWLEQADIVLKRTKVEELGVEFFSDLVENDILFIDSSHMIRPQGDVLFEYLELLPSLNKGVIVHIHDIYTPRNYPLCFIKHHGIFWNEQYLLEAYLSENGTWKILASLNYLKHNYYEEVKRVLPLLSPQSEPGSFYIRKES